MSEPLELPPIAAADQAPAHVLTIAARLLHLAARDGIEMTTGKLQILCYHVQGWTLAYLGRPAFTQVIYAVEGGIWIEELGEAFETFGDEPFTLQDAIRAGIVRNPEAAADAVAGQS